MSQAHVPLGEKLGSFRIDSVVGSGAMGVVYRGTNDKGRTVAVKVVGPEFAQGGKIRDRFEREAEILQQFRHPGIVRFLAVGRYRGTSYIAMEFVPGVTLEKMVQDRGNLPWREAVDLGIQICDALQYAHEHGVVHRDLKPSNLMVTEDGKIKLTDFGIAKDLDATALTATGRTLGTAAYMAPEQIKGTPAVSHKTDLYAFGVVLYQMLSGKPPFDGSSPVVLMHNHLNEPAPRPSAKIHEIPRSLDELVVTLMAKAPADRPWDAAAVGVKLTELRDKAASGKPIAMVWPSSKSAPAKNADFLSPNSSLAGDRPAAPTRKKTRKSRTLDGRDASADSSGFRWLSRSTLETALLVVALVSIGGFIAYWVWPPSQKYLYRQAETLMASSRHADWVTARDEFLDPLDNRFPANPYREQTRIWRDRILLNDAENRGKILASGLDIRMTEPANNAERKFVMYNALASAASNRGDDLTATLKWQELAQELKADDPDDRPWYLLAMARAEQLENAIEDRRQYVLEALADADAASLAGRPDDAATMKRKLVDEYGRFTSLSAILGSLPPVTGAESKAPTPTPRASNPSPQPDASDPSKSPSPGQSKGAREKLAPDDSPRKPPPDDSSSSPPSNRSPES